MSEGTPVRGEVTGTDGAVVHYRIDLGSVDDVGGGIGGDAPLVYCLHGHGMNEDWFARLTQTLLALPYRFVYLRAPFAVKTNDDGSVGASWYEYDGDQEKFVRELQRNERLLADVREQVETTHRLSPSHRFLFGFSQGGYCGSYAALRSPTVYRGLVVSGARIKTEVLAADLPAAASAGMKVLICHGEHDPYVLPEAATRSFEGLRESGVDVRLETLQVGHSVGRGQLTLIAEWMRSVVE